MSYLGLQHYEPGIQYDAHGCLLQFLVNIYPNINDDCVFKINKLESTLCNDYVHTTNNEGVCIEWFKQCSNNKWHVTSVNGSKRDYRCIDGCQKLNTPTKAVYVT